MKPVRTILAAVALASLTAWAQTTPKHVEIFGQKIQYIEAGSGPNVILLHGLGGDSSNWALTIPALATKYHVWAPDQIGFGASDKPMINYRVGTLVDFLEKFCKTEGIDKAIVVGNSLGGWTAIDFALAHPERVEKLVLVDSAGYSLDAQGGVRPTRQTLSTLNPSTLAGAKAVASVIFANPAYATDATAEMLFTQHMRKNDGYTIDQFIDSVLRGDDVVDGKLGGIKAPTMVVWGREDHLIPLPLGERLHKEIAGSQMVVLDHCGHVPQLECAGPFNKALATFITGAESAAR